MKTGLYHLPKKIKTVNDLRLAEKKDLKIGLVYYTKDKNGWIEWMVRQRLTVGTKSMKTTIKNEETIEQYRWYKLNILAMVKHELIYVKL